MPHNLRFSVTFLLAISVRNNKVFNIYSFRNFILKILLECNYKSKELYAQLYHLLNPSDKLNIKEDSTLGKIIINDNIQEFRNYIVEHSLPGMLSFNSFTLTPLEACCHFGAPNIFYFILNLPDDICEDNYITDKCLEQAIYGRNTDIINECLKECDWTTDCVDLMIGTHFHNLLEWVLENHMIRPSRHAEIIALSHNLPAFFLLFQKGYDTTPIERVYPIAADIILMGYAFDFI